MAQERKFYGWVMVAVLWTIYLINLAFPYLGAGVVNSYMAKSLNLDRSTLGLGFTMVTLIAGLSGPLIAYCINKRGIRFPILLGSLALLLGSLLMGLVVGNRWQFILVFGVLMGAGIGFSTAAPVQTGITLWFTKKRAIAMALVLTATGIGGFVAAPLLNKVIAVSGGNWRTAWLFNAALIGFGILLTMLLVKNKPSDLGQVPDGIDVGKALDPTAPVPPSGTDRVFRTTEHWTVREALKTRALWSMLLATIVFLGAGGMFFAHGVIHLRDLGHPPATAAMSLGVLLFSSVAGRLLAGALGGRFEPRYVWAGGMVFIFVGILSVITATSVPQIYLYAIFFGIGYGASYVSWTIMTSNCFGPDSFASIMGFQTPIIAVTSSLAPLLAGMAYDSKGSYSTAFVTLAVLSLIAAGLIFSAKSPESARRAL